MKKKSQQIFELYSFCFEIHILEDKSLVKSRKTKLAWKKYRSKFQFGINRYHRLSTSAFSDKKLFMQRLKNSLDNYKRKRKSEKIKQQKHYEKTALNLTDSTN